MGQSRFWISSHPIYQDAHDAKEALQLLNETRVYQIRRGRDKNHKETFRVVERLQSNEAEVLNQPRNSPPRRKGAGKRRRETLWEKELLSA
jgi:hypothetical protein